MVPAFLVPGPIRNPESEAPKPKEIRNPISETNGGAGSETGNGPHRWDLDFRFWC